MAARRAAPMSRSVLWVPGEPPDGLSLTGLCWPMRTTRSTACELVDGFHQRLTNTTWLASVRVSPSLATRVDASRTQQPDWLLKRSTDRLRSSSDCSPVSRAARNRSGERSIEHATEHLTV